MKFLCKIDPINTLQLLSWANTFQYVCMLNPNHWDKESYPCGVWKKMLAVSNFSLQSSFLDKNLPSQWLFGYLSYDLKNQIENLQSQNPDYLHFPESLCFIPEWLLIWQTDGIEIWSTNTHASKKDFLSAVYTVSLPKPHRKPITLQARTNKEKYIANVQKIQEHIRNGDVYELNYCIEFFAENVYLEPIHTYLRLCRISPMPFSAFLKVKGKYALCASPERFLKKINNTVISQPIKGTAPRRKNLQEDLLQRDRLLHSEKERAENMMIVDLVRNDLARNAQIGSTQVKEIFGVYPFPKVWQMISTIEATIPFEISLQDVLKSTFPMGSMTGAPKIKAMELIDRYEDTKRGLFSGTIGYVTPNQEEGEFNVVIRTIFYDTVSQYLSFMVGSAITYDSHPKEEYHECLLKAQAIYEVLS